MSWMNALRTIVETKIKADWDQGITDQVDFGDNAKFDPPKDGSPWIRVSFTIITNANAEIGTRFQRAKGILTVQCFTKENTGEIVSNSMVEEAGRLFQNVTIGSLQCFAMTPVKVGVNNKWFQQNAKIDFNYNVIS